MKLIPLSQGKFAKVDDEDFESLSQWKWCCSVSGYAVRNTSRVFEKRVIFMHKFILGTSIKMEGDHIDGDRLNNQRNNLRYCSHAENMRNRSKTSKNVSGYKGVSRTRRENQWQASIRVNNKSIHLGYFDTAETAALAYDEACDRYHGKFAHLNFTGRNHANPK